MTGNAFMRFITGAAFPLFARSLFRTLGIPWGNSLLGFLGLLFVPIPYVFYKVRALLKLDPSTAFQLSAVLMMYALVWRESPKSQQARTSRLKSSSHPSSALRGSLPYPSTE